MLHFRLKNRLLVAAQTLALACLVFIVALRCEAQGNLVPNPSFELQDTCPYTTGFQGTSKPLDWENWNQSPEYFDACAGGLGGVDTLLGVPLNGFSYQEALEGDAYVGIFAYGYVSWLPDNNYREYVGCELLQPLEVGETYELSLYTNPALNGTPWPTQWVSNNMGLLFTMQPNIWTDVDQPHFTVRNFAHLHSLAVISDTAGWTLVSGNFVADSAYQYLVLGNFFSNALTDTVHLAGGTSLGAYYFVDEVCVVKAGQQCDGVEGMADFEPKPITAGPNPVAEVLSITGVTRSEVWQVFDCIGRLVRSGTTELGQTDISVATWASGEYVLRIGTDGKRQLRFVVMR